MIINYPHKRGIHCETASTKNLLKFYGHEISEEMVFGIGSGYFFVNFPFQLFPKVCEVVLFRNLPTKILYCFCKRMNIDVVIKNYFSKNKSMKEMDLFLNKGIPFGVVTEIMSLPYFPLNDRPFPGHHIVVVGKENDEYIISDTDSNIKEDAFSKISADDLKKARFISPVVSPKGKMFYIKSIPKEFPLKKAIILGIKGTCYKMLDIPMPFLGVKGIYFHSKRMRNYIKKYGEERAWETVYLQTYISEEAGTGGSGHRYMYANFLKEAGEYLHDEQLLSISNYMREIADKRQTFALETNRHYQGRADRDMDALADMVYAIAQMEEKAFTDLRKWVKKQKI